MQQRDANRKKLPPYFSRSLTSCHTPLSERLSRLIEFSASIFKGTQIHMSLLPYLAGSKNFPKNSFNRCSIFWIVSMWWVDWFSFDWLSFYLYSRPCWLRLQATGNLMPDLRASSPSEESRKVTRKETRVRHKGDVTLHDSHRRFLV